MGLVSKHQLALLLVGCAAVVGTAVAQTSEVLKWNSLLLDQIALKAVPPPRAARLMAMVHVAQFEAVNSVSGKFTPYLTNVRLTPGPLADASAAAAQAAHDVLLATFPDQSYTFTAALQASLSGLSSSVRRESIDLGTAAASAVFVNRSYDGSNSDVAYTVPASPAVGEWVPTAPAYAPYLLPFWAEVKPWSMDSGSQFRPSPPPAPGSADYNAEYEEVKSLGGVSSTTRTADQANIARMWAAGSGTVTPPGQWCQIASQLVQSKNLALEDQARLFALLGISLADAAIGAWDAKLKYHTWRPITAIQAGSSGVAADPTWTPLLTTPPFPAFVSGHSTFSSAGATVLTSFFREDAQTFTVTSAGITRSFTSLWTAAQEAGQSRIYGGIHFQADNVRGFSIGVQIAKVAYSNLLRPVSMRSSSSSRP